MVDTLVLGTSTSKCVGSSPTFGTKIMIMEHSKENGAKSNNGNKLERLFEQETGLQKIRKKDKPKFINTHGLEQIVDFDFKKEIDGVDVFLDLTTTYRSDRLKQKSYNALMYKTHFNKPCKFYMVVQRMVENGKKKNPKLIDGIDDVITLEDAIKMVKE
jgi:hypothetical protein